MTLQDWLVLDNGQCQPRPSAREWDLIRERYYFHRFLTDITDLLDQAPNELEEWDFLPQIRMRVRQLITNSYWLQTRYLDPDPKTGVGILTLYDEIGYPLTVQTVAAIPGVISPVHNHGTWGVVAVLKGQEKHSFWRCVGDLDHPERIERVGERLIGPGEIISFTPAAIHQVETIGEETTISFNLYGDTQPKARFEFDPDRCTARLF